MEWTSVKDKLPNDGVSVLVNVDLTSHRFTGIFFHHENPFHEKIWTSEAQPDYDYGYENITHWMPLPEPPINSILMKTEKLKNEINPRVAKLISLAIDGLLRNDVNEAYHQLYQIGSPNFDKMNEEVWSELDELAAVKPESKTKTLEELADLWSTIFHVDNVEENKRRLTIDIQGYSDQQLAAFKEKMCKNHLQFIYARLLSKHAEHERIDYMIKFKEIIDQL